MPLKLALNEVDLKIKQFYYNVLLPPAFKT